MKRLVLFLVILMPLVALAQNKNIPPNKPKLVVGIIVDQMRVDYIYRYWDKYENNGFKRLVNEGAFYKNTHLNYLFTQTGVGHATISTGTTPSVHGIVANEWFVPLKKKKMYCVDDPKVKGVGTTSENEKMSPVNLLTTTFGDELRLASLQKSKVIGIALKDRASILSAGHSANAAYWYDRTTGFWISSSHYMSQLPTWVDEFNKKKLPDLYLDRLWTTLLPLDQYTESFPDSLPFEYGFGKGQTRFPYDMSFLSMKDKKTRDYSILLASPFGNTLTEDFAIAAILGEDLGKDAHTDYLVVSFSSTDYMGHRYNPFSVEMEDAYLRIDKEIGHLIDFLEKEIGKENLLVYLTADHGSSQHPDYLASLKLPTGKFNASTAITLLKSYLNATLGQGEWIVHYSDGQLYLNQTLIEDSKFSLKEVQEKAAAFLVQINGISNSATAYNMTNTPYTEGIFKFMQNNYNQERSGDIFISLRPGWIEESIYGVDHNSPYPYDTHVPLIFYGWKIPRLTVHQKTSLTDIAPTLSHLLNIPFPSGSNGEVLHQLFK